MAGRTDDHVVALSSNSNIRESPLSAFLAKSSAEARRIASTPGSKDLVHAFAGNEACDADSICSAICMAFLRGEEEGYGSDFGVDARVGKGGDGAVVAFPGKRIHMQLPFLAEIFLVLVCSHLGTLELYFWLVSEDINYQSTCRLLPFFLLCTLRANSERTDRFTANRRRG